MLLQTGCERRPVGSATPKAGDEFALLQEEMMSTLQEGDMSQEEAEEIDELLRHFSATADAAYATPKSGLTMLHLACLYKHAELARCLLLDGASPHAILRSAGFCGVAEADATPLLLAVSGDSSDADEREILTLTHHLLNAGATVNMQREGQLCSHESIYLALLQKADALDDFQPEETDIPLSIGKIAAENGWSKALQSLLQRRNRRLTPGDRLLLHFVTANNTGQQKYRESAELLLKNGISANTQDPHGATPLFTLVTGPSFQHENGSAALPLAELLLRHGADAGIQAENDPEFPGFTPLDFLMTNPSAVQNLREKGINLPAPSIRWDCRDELPREICRAHLREKAHGQITVSARTAERFDTIAQILTPDTRLRQNPLYVEALSAGIDLMARIDSARTSRLLANLPLWTDSLVWKDQHPQALAVLQCITETPALILPKEIICRTAEIMIEQHRHDMAAGMLELLGRCPDADADITRYEQDSRPAMQAGALQARLLKAGLPTAKCYAVQEWLADRGRKADTPTLRKALLLTSQEDIWFGNMPDESLEAVFSAMEEVGAKRAAKAYRAISASLHDAARLDAITADSNAWKYELECATARFILENAHEFTRNTPAEAENTD